MTRLPRPEKTVYHLTPLFAFYDEQGRRHHHDGNVKKASRASGIERTQLKRLLRKHGLLG